MGRFVITATTNATFIPSSFDAANSVNRATGNLSNALKDTSSTANYAIFYNLQGSEAESWAYYNFDCSSIPRDAIINSVVCKFRATAYSSSSGTMKNNYGQVAIGTEKIGTTAATFTTSTYDVKTADTGIYQFKREDLDDIKIYIHSQRGTNSSYYNSTSVNYKLYGAELIVNYSTGYYEYDITVLTQTEYAVVPQPLYSVSGGSNADISVQITNKSKVLIEDNFDEVTSAFTLVNGTTYRYSLTNVQEDHNIVLMESTISLPDEGPNYNYYTVSLSTINANTNPQDGYARYQEGSTQEIVINPNGNLVLARDNGVDISADIVPYQTIKDVSFTTGNPLNAPHTFTLGDDGWYETSTLNSNTTSTTALIRLTFNLEVPCIITISWWGSLASANDYFKISYIDTELTTGSTDTNAKINSSSNSYSSGNPANVVFEDVASGIHTIDVKVRRGTSTSNSVTHKGYFKVTITPLEPTTNFKYTLSNIQDNHSLLFVYGDADYHIVSATVSGDTEPILLPYGDWVLEDGENYKLVVIPESTNQEATISDNGVDVTQYVERHESTENGTTTVNYVYKIFNTNADHSLVISMGVAENNILYYKMNGQWIRINKLYKKQHGVWTEQDLTYVLNNEIFI